MKHMTKKIAGLSLGLALVLGCGVGTLSAAATSVGDVIAHAYAVGLPEAQIQQCIAQYSGGNYTSEQCDRAIAALDNWASQRDQKIEDELNKGTTAPADNADSSVGETTTTAAKANGSSAAQTTTPSAKDFMDMTLDEKVSYINSLPADKRNSFLKQLDTSDQLDIIASMADVGEAFGVNFSVDEISDGAISISAHDADGNLVGVSTFGNTVEATGIPYTVPVLIGGGAVVLAAAGLGIVLCRSKKS